MKRILLGIYMFVVALSVWAVPARPSFFTVTQPDGTELKVRTFGDEFFHGLMTEDGTVVALDEETGWYQPVDATSFEARKQFAIEKKNQINQCRMEQLASARRTMAAKKHDIGVRCPYSGQKHGLVILVNFKDKKFTISQQQYKDVFDKQNYSKGNYIGSVRDYFRDQSYGNLDIEFDVIGPVTVSREYSYYGKNSSSDGGDMRPEEMIVEACLLADSLTDFRKYDWDGDGEVDQVFVVYAGYGENASEDSNTIWPHEYKLSYAHYYGASVGAQTIDGVTVDTYACSCELARSSGSTMNGIGCACHEFSHCLGFPDMYDSDYTGTPTMNDWDLMDGGSYNGANSIGEVPAGYSAYERWIGGWLELTELTDPTAVKDLPNVGDSARAYVIYNENERYEAYILENRQNKRWFKYPTDAHGMLISHVDYDEQAWWYNEVNTSPSHPRMVPVPANNTHGSIYTYSDGKRVYNPTNAELCGQLWPGTSGNTALTNTSTPAATTYNANTDGKYFLNAPIEKITEKDGLISFLFKGGVNLSVPTPTLTVNEKGITFSWELIPEASHYEVKVVSQPHGTSGTLLEEPMSAFVGKEDGTTDLSTKLDSYTTTPGWKGKRVYIGKYGAKIGTSTAQGYLCTPMIKAEGEVVINVTASSYSNDNKNVTVSLLNADKEVITTGNVVADGSNHQITLSGATGECYVRFTPVKRAYLGAISVESAGGKTETIHTVYGSVLTLLANELDETYDYHFQVRAVSDNGSSEWSEVFSHISEVNAIENVATDNHQKNATCYDIFGRRITEGTNAIQIINNHLIYHKK